MTAASGAPAALLALVEEVVAEVGHEENPYFRALEDGSFSKEDFLETQLQFHAAVVFFSRPMAALAARIDDPALRTEILRNVWEEHGEGVGSRSHGATFRTFLSRLQGTSEDEVRAALERRPLWPEVRAFNTLLAGACVLDDPLVGAGVLGVIERMFSHISSLLGRAVVARGFLRPEEMIHYEVHERLDVRHAADFFAVLAASWDRGSAERRLVEQGLWMGAVAFDQLVARLYRMRTRRWLSDEGAPR